MRYLLNFRYCSSFVIPGSRQRQIERCPVTRIGGDEQYTAVGLGDRAADGKSQPQPLWFSCIKWIENLLDGLPVDSPSGVRDG